MLELLDCFVLVYLNYNADSKRFKTRSYYLLEGIIQNYDVITNGKNFYDQAVNSNIKRSEKIRKLTTWQGEGYTSGSLLDYEYTKNHYRLIAVDLRRQKELDADPKAIQQIEFVGQLKNEEGVNADWIQSMFVSTVLEKNQRNKIKIFSRKCNSIIKDGKLLRNESLVNK